MQTNSGDFSVLIPAYRAGKTIAATLQSVASQTHLPLEVLIYEDGCFDNLAHTVTEFAKSVPFQVRLISSPVNGGVSRARNTLMREARGEFLSFLDADDIWAPKHLSYAAASFTSGADIAFSGVTFIDHEGQPMPGQAEPSPEELADFAPSIFFYNFVQCPSTLSIRRCWIDKVGNFDVTLSYGEDLDLWLRLLAAGARWSFTGHCSCAYRKHPTSAMAQTYRVVERMAQFYEKHLHNPLIPRRMRRSALITNRWVQTRLHWRKQPDVAITALRRLVQLQPWHPLYLIALPGVMVWARISRNASALNAKPRTT